jgi:CRP/FNR family transcriptional regulator, nitrogen oxide reductase regulator
MTASVPLHSPALTTMELFLDLPTAALDEVMASARLRHLAKETRIFDQGDPAERAHALIHGSVRIFQSGRDGGQVVIRFIGPGQMFGTVALFTDREYPADAITMTDSLEISWSEAELLDLIGRHPQIAINVIKIIGKRLKEAQERVRELSTQSAERRVAHTVLRLARQAGQSTRNGIAIEFPLRRKDIADISGTTLHTASRILTAWEKAGLLFSDNQRLTIRRPSAIQRIADDLSI